MGMAISTDSDSTQIDTQISSENVGPTSDSIPPSPIDKESKAFKMFQAAASNLWPIYAPEWRTLSKDLKQAQIIIGPDNIIHVKGVGIKAGYYQDHYARSFERQFVAIMNLPDGGEPKILFEE